MREPGRTCVNGKTCETISHRPLSERPNHQETPMRRRKRPTSRRTRSWEWLSDLLGDIAESITSGLFR